jgi:hypothetical protein
MLVSLLVGAALARPPQLGLALGPVVGGGTSTRGTYFSAAPATAVSVTWHLGALESWLGGSASLLVAAQGDDVVPAALLQGELGLGVGGTAAGGGIYGGNGLSGPIVGLYARATLPRRDWLGRLGLESRLFYARGTDTAGLALLLRVEPDWTGADRRARARAEGRDGAEPAVKAPAASPPPEPAPAEDAPSAPPESTPTPTHHDEPY